MPRTKDVLHRYGLVASLLWVTSTLSTLAFADALPAAAELMDRVRATYAALHSYADEGVIVIETALGSGPMIVERHQFTTRYQSPRQFFLDFHKSRGPGAERYLIWGEGEDLQTWWSATRVHEKYPKGKGSAAFAVSALPTKDATTLIVPLLFAGAGLQGPLTSFTPTGAVALEPLAGHQCYKLPGRMGLAYGTGNISGARTVTVWIDGQSLLVRQILEDTPAGSGQGVVARVTTTLTPEPNPTLQPASFHFAVPGEPGSPPRGTDASAVK